MSQTSYSRNSVKVSGSRQDFSANVIDHHNNGSQGFVKPANLFKMRRKNSSTSRNVQPGSITPTSMLAQSPLKCLSNDAIPSPMKKLPTLLRNPFGSNQNSNSSSSSSLFKSPRKTPIKRKLNLDENRSPRKKHRLIEIDEDANLEPPESALDNSNSSNTDCEVNNWSLRTKMRINFKPKCKNFLLDKSSTHRRNKSFEEYGKSLMKATQPDVDFTRKDTSDATISVEAIKNVCTVYQHPYMAWMPLFPRITIDFKSTKEAPPNLAKHSLIARSLHRDWCDSLNDLVSLLSDGLCPYFYMCTDLYNILFRNLSNDTTENGRNGDQIQAHISPCSYGMRSELKKLGVEFVCTADNNETSSSQNSSLNPFLKELESAEESELIHDSGLASSGDSNDSADDKDETSQFLESLGLSQHDFPSLTAPIKRKSLEESSRNQSNNVKSMTTVTGLSNVIKMIGFLKCSGLYTMTNVGKFAGIPPTLLSPVEFRRSTPQQPEVVLSKHVDEVPKPSKVKSKLFHPKDSSPDNDSPTFVELKGTILPGTFQQMHSLLSTSNNMKHSCVSTTLDSTDAFKYI